MRGQYLMAYGPEHEILILTPHMLAHFLNIQCSHFIKHYNMDLDITRPCL